MAFLLVDCNSFFVSCEQLFRPELRNKPVVVLSSNDGCIVARSQQAKKLGLPMGAPVFKHAMTMKTHGVVACSANFPLYADMSRRVMEVLHQLSPDVEEYSIDEAFLYLPDATDCVAFGRKVMETVVQWTGIAVSVGIGKTKTLSKVANDLAKKGDGLLSLMEPEEHLRQLLTQEVWGIGSRLSAQLAREGIITALDLAKAEDTFLQSRFALPVVQTAWELRGTPCLKLDEVVAPRKSITRSRSFGVGITEMKDLEEAISTHAVDAAEKLRSDGSTAAFLTAYITTSPFQEPYYAPSLTYTFPESTDYTPTLITAAKEILKRIYREKLIYKKAGIILGGLTPKSHFQPSLLSSTTSKPELMEVIDALNHGCTTPRVRFAAEGVAPKWRPKKNTISPRYTTRWSELLTIKI